MEKEYNNGYPNLDQEQFSLTKAVVSMLNCRRYIHAQGFQEIYKKAHEDYSCDINGIAQGKAVIVYPDGSTLTNEGFQKTLDRDSLLEESAIKGISLEIEPGYYDSERRLRVITSTFEKQGYKARFAIIDTTKKKRGFFSGLFHDAELFALSYTLSLNQDVIIDSDIEEFRRHQEGLDTTMSKGGILTFNTKPIQAREVGIPQIETPFIDPWEVQISKLRSKKNE